MKLKVNQLQLLYQNEVKNQKHPRNQDQHGQQLKKHKKKKKKQK